VVRIVVELVENQPSAPCQVVRYTVPRERLVVVVIVFLVVFVSDEVSAEQMACAVLVYVVVVEGNVADLSATKGKLAHADTEVPDPLQHLKHDKPHAAGARRRAESDSLGVDAARRLVQQHE
jgi:hypothetical protein